MWAFVILPKIFVHQHMLEWVGVRGSEPEWAGVSGSEPEWAGVSGSEREWAGVSGSEREWAGVSGNERENWQENDKHQDVSLVRTDCWMTSRAWYVSGPIYCVFSWLNAWLFKKIILAYKTLVWWITGKWLPKVLMKDCNLHVKKLQT